MESSAGIPDPVVDVLEHSTIGYLTTISKKGELYSYPVAFYYSDQHVYFVTPVSAAKYKMIQNNPTVSLIVDNRQLTLNACGAMVQGKARIFSVTRTILSILSVGPKVAGFSKKYPGMLTFYAKGKELPDERKLYKYRLIRIDPVKIVYWVGYTFGRYVPKKEASLAGRLHLGRKKEQDAEGLAGLLGSADEDLPMPETPSDHDWLAHVDDAALQGLLSDEERILIGAYRKTEKVGPRITDEEKRLLNRWKRQNT